MGQAGQIVEGKHMRIVGGDDEVAFFARERPHRRHVWVDQILEELRKNRAAEAHGWRADDAPAVGSDLDGAPALIGEIEIDAAGMLREANMDRPLGAVKLSLRLKEIERRPNFRGARRRARSFVMAAPQPGAEPLAADGPSFPIAVD